MGENAELRRRIRQILGTDAPEEDGPEEDGLEDLREKVRQQLAPQQTVPTEQPAGGPVNPLGPSPLRQPGQEAPPSQQGNVAVSGATPEIATDVNAAFGVPVAATQTLERPTTEQLGELERQGRLFAPDGRPLQPLTPEFIQQRGRQGVVPNIPQRVGQDQRVRAIAALAPPALEAFQRFITEPITGALSFAGQAAPMTPPAFGRLIRESDLNRNVVEQFRANQNPVSAFGEAFRQTDFPTTEVSLPFRVPLPGGRSLQDVDVGVKGALEATLGDAPFAIGGAAIAGVRGGLRQAARQTGRQATRKALRSGIEQDVGKLIDPLSPISLDPSVARRDFLRQRPAIAEGDVGRLIDQSPAIRPPLPRQVVERDVAAVTGDRIAPGLSPSIGSRTGVTREVIAARQLALRGGRQQVAREAAEKVPDALDIGGLPSTLASPPSAQSAIRGQTQAVANRSVLPTRPATTPAPLRQQADELFDRQISFKEAPVPLGERVTGSVQELQRQVVDNLYPIQRFVKAAEQGGLELSTAENPYLMARLHRGIRGKANTFIEQGTVGKKFWKIDPAGNTVPDFKGPGLQQVLRPVKEGDKYKDFVQYFTGLRAVELNAQGIKTGFADNLARVKVADLERLNPEFKSVVQGVYRYQDEVLQYANEMGLISNEFLRNLRGKYKNYAPFNRVLDGLESKGFLGRKLANVTTPIRRIKGSENVVVNPLENVIKNTHAIVDAADRNQVTVLMARLVEEVPELKPLFRPKRTPTSRVATVTAKDLGIDITGLDPADAEKLVDIYRPSGFAKGSNEVTAMINGEKRFFDVDPDLQKGLLALESQEMGMLTKFLGAPARWLRAGAVLNPDFMVKNFMRDQMTAFTYSRAGFMPGIDWMKGVGQMMGKSDEYKLFRLSGGEGANLVSLDRTGLGKTAEQIASDRGFKDFIKSPIEILRILSEFTENATRVGDFRRATRAGQDPLTAGFNAREVTQDFSVRGGDTVMRAVNQIIPFFNANVGSWRRIVREFKERPMQASVKAFMGITLPSLLLYSVNRNNPKYQEIPQWQKDTFWIIPTPNDGPMLRLPKPFMLGQLFGSMPERFWEFVDKRDPELFKKGIGNAVQQGTPGFLPQAVLPIVENMSDHNFFLNRPIIPRGREIAPAALQYSGTTSEAAKALGSWVNFSPAQIDNIFRAYTGGIGTTLVDLLDKPLKAVGATPNIPSPSPELSDIPVLRSFVVRDPTGSSSESVNNFYDKLDHFQKLEFAIREFQALGEEGQKRMNDLVDKHPEAGFWSNRDTQSGISSRTAQGLRQVASMMSDVRRQQRLIFNSRDLTPQQKRQAIRETNQALTDIARKALEDLPRP